jgi:hypothetical protein
VLSVSEFTLIMLVSIFEKNLTLIVYVEVCSCNDTFRADTAGLRASTVG